MEKKEVLEGLLNMLRRMENKDLSGCSFGTKGRPLILRGNFNRLDLSGGKGYIEIHSEFSNLIDASEAKGLILTLVGKFNIVDISGGKVKVNASEAEINILDASGSEEFSESPK